MNKYELFWGVPCNLLQCNELKFKTDELLKVVRVIVFLLRVVFLALTSIVQGVPFHVISIGIEREEFALHCPNFSNQIHWSWRN